MDPNLQGWQEILVFLGILFGTITAGYALYRKIFHKAICKFCEAVNDFFKVGSTVKAMTDKVNYVYDELKPNSGSSVKDSVKRIEDNIIVLMNKHRIILDDYHTGIVETNQKGEITWANATYLELTNRELREILGNGWINAVHPEDRDRVFQEWSQAMQQARNFESTFRILDQNGSSLVVQGYAFPIKGRERIQGYIGKIKIVMAEGVDDA